MGSYVLSDYRSIQMMLQESFIQPLYDRLPLPFLFISFGQVVLLSVPEEGYMGSFRVQDVWAWRSFHFSNVVIKLSRPCIFFFWLDAQFKVYTCAIDEYIFLVRP